MNIKESKFWPPFYVKPRHPGRWPFSDDVTTRICRHAGREASAMLYVALHKNRADGKDVNSALQAVYYEPFTYWDWHGVDAEDDSASKHKKQLVWERQRGFTAADGEEHGYPTPQEAWQRFRRLIDGNTERSRWVKKIAVAHWMSVEDLSWMFQNLPSLEALDLSDIARLTVEPYKGYAKEPPATMTDTWALFFNRMPRECPAKETAHRLKWLGLPDFRGTSLVAPRILLNKFLPICTNLQTLSIRGEYREEIPPPSLSGHEYVCEFIRGIRESTPSSVAALELRLSIPFLRELLVALRAEPRLNITQIGLDLGAWVQIYPLMITSKAILDSQVVSAASNAARKARFDIYEQVHDKVMPISSKWILPPAPEEDTPDIADVPDSSGSPTFEKLDARSTFQHEPYNAKGGSDIREYRCDRSKLGSRKKCSNADPKHHKELLGSLERTHVNTLPSMLVKLHDAGQTAASQDYSLYSLKPEWQTNSTTPLHPFTMIQKYQPVPTLSIEQGRDYKEPVVDRLKEAYAWLNTTFLWRPVFDWDYFVRSGMESLKEDLDVAFSSIQQQYELGNVTKSNNEVLIGEVAKQFKIMRDAGIPIHVLLGRRNSDESSLYWGWPYSSDVWEQSLKAPFDAGLTPIVAHIDTLSIFYDLRNPLDDRRLEEIDRRQPYRQPEAYCPRPVDPWRSTKNSPFKKQWQDRPSRIFKSNTQKTANKKTIGKKFYVSLASNLTSCPPTGEYADEHAYDDPEHDKALPETLHQVTRRAAFEREAIGWQRFWTKYASQMTSLKELRVRMPRSFDRVGSWSLYELLSPKKFWRMFGYADERGHMQTRQDLLHHVADDFKLHTHAAQENIWPAGRFVRRTWTLWMPGPMDTTEVALHRGTGEIESSTSHPSASNENTVPTKASKLAGEKSEKEELKKAVKQARETARKEEELEASLPPAEREQLVTRDPATVLGSKDVERRLTGTYGRHIHAVAQRTWRAEMQSYIEQLQDGMPTGDETVNNAYKAGTHSEVSEATITRNVLRDTRELLRKRKQNFRPEDVFAPCDHLDCTNGLELVKHTTNYAAEERKRRAGPAKEDGDAAETSKSMSKPRSTNPTAGALPSGPQQPRASPSESSSESSSSESTSSDEDDSRPVKFIPAVSTQRITATRTVTAQQGSQAVHTSHTTQTTQTKQHAPTVRQLELDQQLADNMAAGQAQKIPRFGRGQDKQPTNEEQAAEKKRLVEENRAAVAKAEAAEKARVTAEMVAEVAEKKADEVKKQNAEVKRQAAAEKKKAKEIEAAAKKMAADEKAAKEEAERKADEVKKQAAAEKKELKKQADAEKKKLKESEATAKRAAAKEKAAREDAQLKADEVAEATKETAIKAVEAVNTEDTPDVIPTIERTPPAKPTKKRTKSPKTPKSNSPKNPKGIKRKQPSQDPSDDSPVDKPVKTNKPRLSKGASTTSTPVRRSERLRTQTPTKTPTTKVELPPDRSVTESSESDIDDDKDKQKKGRKVKKEPGSAGGYESPVSAKKRTPTKDAKAARGKATGGEGRGGRAAAPAKGKGKGKKRAAADDDDEDEDEEIDQIAKKKPVKKKPKKVKKVDNDDDVTR